MTGPQSPRLARLTQAQARALTTVARLGTDRVVTPRCQDGAAAPAPWRVSLQPAVVAESGAHGVRWARADWEGATVSLGLPGHACEDWLALRLPDLPVAALPACFVDAAWDAMIADALAALGVETQCAGIRLSTEPQAGRPAACRYAWRVSMRATDSGRTIAAELAVDEAGLSRLAELLGRLPLGTADMPAGDGGACACPDALPIVLSARLGTTVLDGQALRHLAPGDVVLFDRCMATADGELWFRTRDGQGLRARPCAAAGSRYVVTQEWSLLMDDLSPETPGGERASHFDAQHEVPAEAASGIPDGSYGEPFDRADDGYDTPFDGGDDGYGAAFDAGGPRYGGASRGPDDGYDPYDVERHEGSPANAWTSGQGGDPADPPPTDMAEAGARGPAPREGGLDIDRIPVRLDFDLGEQSLPLGTLRRLQPGEFFDLQRRLDAGPVHIRANGVPIGTAELVDIEGRVGVRVLSLSLDCLPCP